MKMLKKRAKFTIDPTFSVLEKAKLFSCYSIFALNKAVNDKYLWVAIVASGDRTKESGGSDPQIPRL
jgi:hypothetical protein